MALGTDNVTVTTAATFIPEIWSDEIAAAYKKSLVAANLVKKMSFKGKKRRYSSYPCSNSWFSSF